VNDPDVEPVELPDGFENLPPSEQVAYLRAVLEQLDTDAAEMQAERAWSALDDLAVILDDIESRE